MHTVLTVLLILLCLQSLVKFAIWFLVPYPARIKRFVAYYRRGNRVISVYDSATLAVMAALVVLLALIDMHYTSFTTGLLVGMLTIQVFIHRFARVLPAEKAPQTPASPRQLMSYAIQAHPGLAWRETAFMTVLFAWALYMLITKGLLG